jgi:hypothetical protein
MRNKMIQQLINNEVNLSAYVLSEGGDGAASGKLAKPYNIYGGIIKLASQRSSKANSLYHVLIHQDMYFKTSKQIYKY